MLYCLSEFCRRFTLSASINWNLSCATKGYNPFKIERQIYDMTPHHLHISSHLDVFNLDNIFNGSFDLWKVGLGQILNFTDQVLMLYSFYIFSAIIGHYPLCPRGCSSCSSINGCVTCRPRYYLYLHREGMRQSGMCLHSCPLGHYGVRHKDHSLCYS